MRNNLRSCTARSRRQPAFTLVEMLITITAASMLMLLAVQMLQRAMQLAQNTRQASVRNQATRQFLDEFRRDVRTASSIDLKSATHLLLQSSDGAEVTYAIEDERIMRLENSSSERTRRDALHLDHNSRAILLEMSNPQRVLLTIDKQLEHNQFEHKGPGGEPETRSQRRVEAAVGRWHPETDTAEAAL